MAGWLKVLLKIVGALLLLLIILLTGLSIYVSGHKEKILSLVTADFNKNLNGKLNVGGLETSFFSSFPNLSVTLLNVSLRDKEWEHHHQSLLEGKKLSVAVNVAALLKGVISIHHVSINDAAIILYTDSTGYSNTSIFKKDSLKSDKKSKSSLSAQLGRLSLENVSFTIDDQRAKKLFKFEVTRLKSVLDFPDSGWRANLHINVLSKSMAFKMKNGSFIKDKVLEGDLIAGYNQKSGDINVTSHNFSIGGDDFKIIARFAVDKKPAGFIFHITSDKLLWKHTAELVSPNITKKLNMFDIDKPMVVDAIIAGNFSGGGDPRLYITADVNDSKLSTPGGAIENCTFKGLFFNNNAKDKPFGDPNSVIRVFHLTGNYNHIPFEIDTGSITNLVKPIAAGNFKANFPVSKLNDWLKGSIAKFGSGNATINLRFNADIVNYQINKPLIGGNISIKNADVNYLPANLNFKNTSVSINFIHNDLIIKNTRLQVGKSVVFMQARVSNFLNLYYNAPEKIHLNLQVNSTQLHLGEFLGLLSRKQQPVAPGKSDRAGEKSLDQLRNFLTKAKVNVHVRAANVHYFKFLATDATADLALSRAGFQLNNVNLKSSGGSLKIDAAIESGVPQSSFTLHTIVSNVDIHDFFYVFDNFGLKGITYQNLQGFLSANVDVTGLTDNQAHAVPGSFKGTVAINLKNGALLNFQPLISVGKFAFPFRNLHDIKIPNLDAKFDLQGNKIIINPMQITSSVINADVAGVYSLANETNITFDVPLRNPKNDTAITDARERAKKRNKGIVLHLRATNDEKGKLKVGRNKDHKLL
jgi:hypothetical protein